MNKKISAFLALALLVVSMVFTVGCSSTNQETAKEYTAVLYFTNNEYAQTGNEELDHLIRAGDFKFKSEEGRQYFYLVNVALRTVPDGLAGAGTCIDGKIVVNDVTAKDGIAIVDLAGANMNGGSLTESFVIGQIVDSLLGSFEELNSIQFLVDGEKAESLMGHFDVRQPFTREMNQL